MESAEGRYSLKRIQLLRILPLLFEERAGVRRRKSQGEGEIQTPFVPCILYAVFLRTPPETRVLLA
jgi:hypothetical protein